MKREDRLRGILEDCVDACYIVYGKDSDEPIIDVALEEVLKEFEGLEKENDMLEKTNVPIEVFNLVEKDNVRLEKEIKELKKVNQEYGKTMSLAFIRNLQEQINQLKQRELDEEQKRP